MMDMRVFERTIVRLKNNSRIDSSTDCWLWIRRKNPDGYGQTEFKILGEWKQISVHRLSAHLYLGMPIKSTYHVLHKTTCPNRNCWNPNHIYLGDQSDNAIDRVTTKTHNMVRKTHCNKGHLLTGIVNSIRDGKYRYCKVCASNSSRLHRRNKK